MSTQAATTTDHYALSQWASTDHVRREDFNADNLLIDAALQENADAITAASAALATHASAHNNPHQVTAAQTGAALSGHTHNAAEVSFTPGDTGLEATNVAGAISELVAANGNYREMVFGSYTGTQYSSTMNQAALTITLGFTPSAVLIGGTLFYTPVNSAKVADPLPGVFGLATTDAPFVTRKQYSDGSGSNVNAIVITDGGFSVLEPFTYRYPYSYIAFK